MPIRITSKKEGFRRCGIAHSEKPAVYPDDRFSAEELEMLEAEPMLIVERIAGEDGGRKTEDGGRKAEDGGRKTEEGKAAGSKGRSVKK